MRAWQRTRIALPVMLGAVVVAAVWGLGRSGSSTASFNADVRPILNDRCLQCHGGVKAQSGFSLLFEEEAFSANESGKRAIVAGKPTDSELIHRITLPANHDDRMPPDGDPLTEHEIDILKEWIADGAIWETHWAYHAPRQPDLPEARAAWHRNGIDAFIAERLDQADLSPAPQADCPTLLRRVSLDLVGLPPRGDDVSAACGSFSHDTYADFVDTLLDSPQFGEHWAAMWLDLARYADTKGYEKDLHRTIWMYRDWLIDAFNRDLPFDQFTIEQLAGDLLPDATEQQRIATAFHRNTMTNDEGGTDDEEFRVVAVIDRVNTTWEVWQGTTMACVQCHSHPYDPFRHEDYYTSFAVFNNTADTDHPSEAPNLIAFSHQDETSVDSLLAWFANQQATDLSAHQTRFEKTEALLYPNGFTPANALDGSSKVRVQSNGRVDQIKDGAWLRFNSVALNNLAAITFSYPPSQAGSIVSVHAGSPTGTLLGTDTLHAASGWSVDRRHRLTLNSASGQQALFVRFRLLDAGQEFALDGLYFHHDATKNTSGSQNYEANARRLAAFQPVSTPVFATFSNDSSRVTTVFDRGSWLSPTDTVSADVPGSLPPMSESMPKNRLGFAQWLVSGDNPLTSRVTVNRFWAQLFGRGLVETLEDFGTQGAAPSHPELLDWLALRFQDEHAWSVKALLREMVLSATYQQSSRIDPDAYTIDPQNLLLARGPRVRLSAEQIRDQALAVSGLLSAKMYGPSVMPPQPPGIWNNPYSGAYWKTSEGEDRYRRAVYTYQKRTAPYPAMITFDGPSREFCVSRRISTNTPLQALVTLNDDVYVEAAHALAQRMLAEGGSTIDDQLRFGYRAALFADPSAETVAELRTVYDEALSAFDTELPSGFVFTSADTQETSEAALAVAANVILNLDAFITKN